MNKKISELKTIFGCFFILSFFLVLIGLLFIYSSSSIYALERFGSSFYFLKNQSLFLFLSLFAGFIISLCPYTFIKKMVPLFFIGSFITLLAALLSPFALKVHGSSRWILLFGWSLQPGEFLKNSFIVYSAYLLSKSGSLVSLKTTLFKIIGILIVCSALLLKQPDFGATITLFLSTLCLLFVAGVQLRMLTTIGALAIPLIIIIVIRAQYRMHRIINFLNPWADPHGRGYQIIQSLIAIGSGGIWGVGVSHSRQKFFYLPMQHTDFIFSIIGEETGLVGAFLLIGCYITWCYLGIKLASLFHDQFSQYVTFGFTALITLQVIMNLCVVTGLIPTKGLGLPFISYGGSALLSNFIVLGLIACCVRHAAQNPPHV